MDDWKDLRYKGELHAYMIPPTDLNDTYGELEGVDWSTLSITAQYYSDTRTSGSLTFVNTNWIPDSFIRIVYEVPERDYKRVLGTYAVTDAPETYENGQWKTTATLHSMLYTMSLDIAANRKTLKKNALYTTAMKSELLAADREYILEDALEGRVSSTTVMPSGVSRLARMFTFCQNTNNRLDVDPEGRITVEPYTKPAAKSSKLTVDIEDERGLTMDGITRSTNYATVPTSAAVIYRYTEQVGGKSVEREISAVAMVSTASHQHQMHRGYNVVDLHTLSEMQPATEARAQKLALAYLANDGGEKVEWEFKMKYLPLWEGDVVDLVVSSGNERYSGTRKCLVKNITLTGPYLDMQLTLKETASGDTE